MGQPSDQHRNHGIRPVDQLRDEFRERLELFYRKLKLAPPYDSVEKALGLLTIRLTSMSPDEVHRLCSDPARRWTEFRKAFVESGLSHKHRGIIAGLARSRQNLDLPPEFDHLLNVYVATPKV
jgi:hypothetical protein